MTDNITIKGLNVKKLNFIKLLFLPKSKKIHVIKAIDEQIKIYKELYNKKKIIINSHQHVHSIPWIYKYLLNNKSISEIRFTNEFFLLVLVRGNLISILRNFFFVFLILKILSFFNKKKTNKQFFGLLYTNVMNRRIYNKIIKKYEKYNLEILFHPGKASKNEKHYFSDDLFYNYFNSNKRDMEFYELYEVKKNFDNY